mgnify:CR=1 FL=1
MHPMRLIMVPGASHHGGKAVTSGDSRPTTRVRGSKEGSGIEVDQAGHLPALPEQEPVVGPFLKSHSIEAIISSIIGEMVH